MTAVRGSTFVPSRVTTSPSPSRSAWSGGLGSAIGFRAGPRLRGLRVRVRLGVGLAGDRLQLVLEVGQLLEALDADPLEEVAGRAVEVRAGGLVHAGLLDQAAGKQGAHHAVDV